MQNVFSTPRQLWVFSRRFVKAFIGNNGLLLAGGVGYNMLLSLVPLLVVLLLGLSHVWPRDQIVAILDRELHHVVPGHAGTFTTAVTAFIDDSEVIGVVVVAVLWWSLLFRRRHRPLSLSTRCWVSVDCGRRRLPRCGSDRNRAGNHVAKHVGGCDCFCRGELF